MSRTGNVNHIQIIPFDNTVTVSPDKVLSRYCSPVTYNFLFNMIHSKWFAKQRVIQQIQLTSGQIVCCTPICVHLLQHLITQRLLLKTSIFAHNELLSKFSFSLIFFNISHYIGNRQILQPFLSFFLRFLSLCQKNNNITCFFVHIFYNQSK